jgi:hypothetical protein
MHEGCSNGKGTIARTSGWRAAGSAMTVPAAQSGHHSSILRAARLAAVLDARSWTGYSYRFRFDASAAPNESIPVRDAFYTLNVLLGLSQCAEVAGRARVDNLPTEISLYCLHGLNCTHRCQPRTPAKGLSSAAGNGSGCMNS